MELSYVPQHCQGVETQHTRSMANVYTQTQLLSIQHEGLDPHQMGKQASCYIRELFYYVVLSVPKTQHQLLFAANLFSIVFSPHENAYKDAH